MHETNVNRKDQKYFTYDNDNKSLNMSSRTPWNNDDIFHKGG